MNNIYALVAVSSVNRWVIANDKAEYKLYAVPEYVVSYDARRDIENYVRTTYGWAGVSMVARSESLSAIRSVARDHINYLRYHCYGSDKYRAMDQIQRIIDDTYAGVIVNDRAPEKVVVVERPTTVVYRRSNTWGDLLCDCINAACNGTSVSRESRRRQVVHHC